jgi:hypothetical protein
MKTINLKYRLLEARFILNNKSTYPKSSILRAEKLLRENQCIEPNIKAVSDIDRERIKKKYPKTYK